MGVTDLVALVRARGDLSADDVDRLVGLVADWGIISDLGVADLTLWVPSWDGGGYQAVAHRRPDTGRTLFPEEVVGTFVGRGRRTELDRSAAAGDVESAVDAAGASHVIYPLTRTGAVLALVERSAVPVPEGAMGRLESAYVEAADRLCDLMVRGEFPTSQGLDTPPPRVGGGFIRLEVDGRVRYASPNAESAIHRLGAAVDLQGAHLGSVLARLHDPWSQREHLQRLASGATSGRAVVEHGDAALEIDVISLESAGAIVLLRDITELRRRERDLESTTAGLREVHHRVKNNLQMVAALLRLQARRADEPEVTRALREASARVGAIAVVHDALAHVPASAAPDSPGAGAVDLDEVCARIVSTVSALAPGTRATVAGTVGLVDADEAATIGMCVSELVTNAVTHGGPGVTVDVTLAREAGSVHCRVADNGPGGVAAGESSDGLGMTIVRSLVGGVGGEASWTSSPTGGTCAYIRFPLRRNDNRV